MRFIWGEGTKKYGKRKRDKAALDQLQLGSLFTTRNVLLLAHHQKKDRY
jgi:hypothetical protein